MILRITCLLLRILLLIIIIFGISFSLSFFFTCSQPVLTPRVICFFIVVLQLTQMFHSNNKFSFLFWPNIVDFFLSPINLSFFIIPNFEQVDCEDLRTQTKN